MRRTNSSATHHFPVLHQDAAKYPSFIFNVSSEPVMGIVHGNQTRTSAFWPLMVLLCG